MISNTLSHVKLTQWNYCNVWHLMCCLTVEVNAVNAVNNITDIVRKTIAILLTHMYGVHQLKHTL